jgi:hypothetical protein
MTACKEQLVNDSLSTTTCQLQLVNDSLLIQISTDSLTTTAFLSPVFSVSHPSYLEEHDPDSFGIFYARSRAFANFGRVNNDSLPMTV